MKNTFFHIEDGFNAFCPAANAQISEAERSEILFNARPSNRYEAIRILNAHEADRYFARRDLGACYHAVCDFAHYASRVDDPYAITVARDEFSDFLRAVEIAENVGIL